MPSISVSPPLPGFGLRLDYGPHIDDENVVLFPSALDPRLDDRSSEIRLPMLPLREITMLQFMNQVTDKNEWQHKVFNDAITQKWKAEAIQSPGADFTAEMTDYCIEELKDKADLYKKTGFTHVYNGDVVKSDTVIPDDLRSALKAAVASLEDVPSKQRDWHLASTRRTTVGLEDFISFCGRGEVIPIPAEDQSVIKVYGRKQRVYSRRFQWLPCDVDISSDTPKIVSYINNLHPRDHTVLYDIIEKVIENVIPLWNATLTSLLKLEWPERVVFSEIDYGDLEDYTEKEGPKQEEGEGEDEDAFWDRKEEWKNERKKEFIVLPNPEPFAPPGFDEEGNVDLKADFGSSGLQIIVKLANIHLTPEKPTYEGGAWHVEGQLNEHICATAIYYYDNENITTSHLAFRQASEAVWVQEDIPYEQGDWTWLQLVYGLQNEEPAFQTVGSIEAREGRLVTFPNILQHQVQPFELADKTKPGHRKILALFLVDPHMKIISTANVPCQRRDWWGRKVTSDTDVLAKFPLELRDKVINEVGDFPFTLGRAKELREELMAGRKEYVMGYQAQNFTSITISLCEH